MRNKTWAIMDDKGIISAGTESEIKSEWEQIISGNKEAYDYVVGNNRHSGDLRLICIIDQWNG